MKHRIDKIKEDRKQTEEQLQEIEEQINRLKSIAFSLFSRPEGIEFMREVYKYSGIHQNDDKLDLNPSVLAVEKVRKQFYIRCFRRFFSNEMIAEIEKAE